MLVKCARIILLLSPLLAAKHEPLCLSRYDYDYKVLRDIVTLEQDMQKLREEIDAQKDTNAEQKRVIKQLEITTKDGFQRIDQHMSDVGKGSGSTYVRWGRTSCPGNSSDLVYTGYSAGSHFQHSGGAANYLCLPSDPLWRDFDDSVQSKGLIYGVEYQIFGSYSEKFFKKNLGNNNAPCVVCHSSRDSVLFIPGRNACYGGWTLEYSGYLVADNHGHTAASEYVCLDAEAEVVPGGGSDTNEKLFYLVESKCGALNCLPYVDGRELTCVICTR